MDPRDHGLSIPDYIHELYADFPKLGAPLQGGNRGCIRIWRFPKIRGTLIGCPQKKDCGILGSILGSPYFGKLLYWNSSMTLSTA